MAVSWIRPSPPTVAPPGQIGPGLLNRYGPATQGVARRVGDRSGRRRPDGGGLGRYQDGCKREAGDGAHGEATAQKRRNHTTSGTNTVNNMAADEGTASSLSVISRHLNATT